MKDISCVGVFSSDTAYTLQILAQKDSNPTVVTILLSLESVFAVIAVAIIRSNRCQIASISAAC